VAKVAARERIAGNPFHVLALPATASRAEIERAGQRWLGALALGLAEVQTYDTPLGPQPRTEPAVRRAMAELRDPNRRLLHELWALPGDGVGAEGAPGEVERDGAALRVDRGGTAPRSERGGAGRRPAGEGAAAEADGTGARRETGGGMRRPVREEPPAEAAAPVRWVGALAALGWRRRR
jgi:hypothetical protein